MINTVDIHLLGAPYSVTVNTSQLISCLCVGSQEKWSVVECDVQQEE